MNLKGIKSNFFLKFDSGLKNSFISKFSSYFILEIQFNKDFNFLLDLSSFIKYSTSYFDFISFLYFSKSFKKLAEFSTVSINLGKKSKFFPFFLRKKSWISKIEQSETNSLFKIFEIESKIWVIIVFLKGINFSNWYETENKYHISKINSWDIISFGFNEFIVLSFEIVKGLFFNKRIFFFKNFI